jgi:hypothetical protein
MEDVCKDELSHKKGVTTKVMNPTMCWISGEDAGKIYWEKTVLANDVFYSLRFEYDETLKDGFDPLVTHVNASWKHPK